MIKIVFTTIFLTITAMGIVVSLFFNTILSTLAIVSPSIQSLQSSNKIVQKMKEQLVQKKKTAPKRLTKRALRRVFTGVLAASTVGSAAVAVAITALEIEDYCEEQKEIENYLALLNGKKTHVKFDSKKCLDEGKEDAASILKEAKNSTSKAIANAMDRSSNFSSKKWKVLKKVGIQTRQDSIKEANAVWDSAKSALFK